MALSENDFIEVNFTGKIKNTEEIFDSNIKEDLKEINSQRKNQGQDVIEPKPFRFPLGKEMFLKGIDEFLIGKKISKYPETYSIELTPEKAFGPRNQELIQMMPVRTFKEHGLNPIQGMSFNFDGRPGKVLTVSGGRVIVDFNNALAGKTVQYKVEVLRKIEDFKEKVEALNEFFFRKEIPFNIKNLKDKKKKLILDFENEQEQFKQIAKMFKDKYEELLGLDVEIKGVEDKPKEEVKDKKEENSGKKKGNSDKKSQ